MDHPIKAALAALAPIIDMHAHPPYGPGGIESMLEAAWRTGIRRILFACLGSSAMTPYPSFDEVQHGNEEVYGLVAKYPGFVFGYVYVNPTLPAALDILEDGLARPGILGIKLWISCRDADGRLDPVYPVLERASEQRAPVLIHSFYRSGGNLPGGGDAETRGRGDAGGDEVSSCLRVSVSKKRHVAAITPALNSATSPYMRISWL